MPRIWTVHRDTYFTLNVQTKCKRNDFFLCQESRNYIEKKMFFQRCRWVVGVKTLEQSSQFESLWPDHFNVWNSFSFFLFDLRTVFRAENNSICVIHLNNYHFCIRRRQVTIIAIIWINNRPNYSTRQPIPMNSLYDRFRKITGVCFIFCILNFSNNKLGKLIFIWPWFE